MANRPGKGNSVERTGGAGATTSAVFTFGRFQPPTLGHQILIDNVIAAAAAKGADAYIFVSAKTNDVEAYKKSKKYAEMMERGEFVSTDSNENPLDPYTKVMFLQKQHAGKNVKFVNTLECKCPTIFSVVDALRTAGYKDLTMLVGSDRVPTFQRILAPKAGGAGDGADLPKPVEVVSAGEERNISANKAAAAKGAAGGAGASIALKAMSGTKMRKAAVAGDLETLKVGVKFREVSDANVKTLANKIRIGLGYEPLAGGGCGGSRRSKSRRRTRRRRGST